MKKIFALSLIIAFALTGCLQATQPTSFRIDDELMNMFPTDTQYFLKDVNPDVVSMEYLIENYEKYKTEIGSDRNDFFVIVKGTITDIKITNYSKEDLTIMENKEMAKLLENVISYDFYLDNCDLPLGENILSGDPEPTLEIDKEYYFFVTVSELADEPSFSVIEIFNFN